MAGGGRRVPAKPIIRRIEPIRETAASFGIWRGKKGASGIQNPFSFMGSSEVNLRRTPKGSSEHLKIVHARRSELLSASQLDVSESGLTLNIKLPPRHHCTDVQLTLYTRKCGFCCFSCFSVQDKVIFCAADERLETKSDLF